MRCKPAGIHLSVDLLDETGKVACSGNGKMFIPHSTQYAFISDIDDTIMVSNSATTFRRLKELFFRNPRTRSIFPDVGRHYRLLAMNYDGRKCQMRFSMYPAANGIYTTTSTNFSTSMDYHKGSFY